MPPSLHITAQEFAELCIANPDAVLSLTTGSKSEQIPTGGEIGRRNAHISFRLDNWNEQHQLGEVFNSSTGFRLPIELALPTDRIPRLCHKLVEYLTNGALLGWLILPAEEAVEVYRARQAPEVISQPTALSGEDVLPGCVLDLTEILA